MNTEIRVTPGKAMSSAIPLGLLLGLMGPEDLSKLNRYMEPSRHQCVQCRTNIPPGRAGRRCEGCRG